VLHLALPILGNHGLFLGLAIFMLLRALSLLFYFRNIETVIRNREFSDT
jgi:Na+-driven multidrug efflux pump